MEVVVAHEPFAAQQIPAGFRRRQLRTPRSCRATARQRRRPDVEDVEPGRDPVFPRVAQQSPIAHAQRQRRREQQPRGVQAEGADPGGHGRGAEVRHQVPVQLGRGRPAQPHVELGRGAPRAGREQGVAPLRRIAGHAAQVHGDPGHGRHALVRFAEGLQAAHTDVGLAERQLVSDPQRAGAERAGDDRARALDRERPVDPEPDVRSRVRRRQAGGKPGQPGAQLVEARTGRPADGDSGHLAERCLRDFPRRRRRGRGGVRAVGLGDDEQAVADPERVERGQVFRRLRHPALVRGDDEQHGRHRADPGQHVRHEPPVPGNVDERELLAGQARPGEAEVQRQATAALLSPPVRLHAGEPADERGLPVVDVPGRGDHPHRRTASRSITSSVGRTARRSSRHFSRTIRPTTGGSPRRSSAA